MNKIIVTEVYNRAEKFANFLKECNMKDDI